MREVLSLQACVDVCTCVFLHVGPTGKLHMQTERPASMPSGKTRTVLIILLNAYNARTCQTIAKCTLASTGPTKPPFQYQSCTPCLEAKPTYCVTPKFLAPKVPSPCPMRIQGPSTQSNDPARAWPIQSEADPKAHFRCRRFTPRLSQPNDCASSIVLAVCQRVCFDSVLMV